ncbi:MAG: NifB/NifX family molybdenum-iron cluster-binding protein [bacterium]
MKICIPTETEEGKTAKVYGHFGSAPYFTIYDTEKDTCEIMNNSNQHHSHGTCHPMGSLESKNIDAVVCGGMGMRAIQKLNESGIRAYRASEGTVEEVAKQYATNKLEELTPGNACAQHECH